MSRLTRAEAQERNRARVLAAARAEFLERGYRDAKIDTIAERAELTRGAVYSNFPGKRALYFAVLADSAAEDPGPATATTDREALGALARAWLTRLPLATDDRYAALARDLATEIAADAKTRRPYAQLLSLQAIVLGLALERLRPGGRRVRVAEAALTVLHGAGRVAASAPGFGEPFHVVRVCEALARLDLDDEWPARTLVPPVRPVDEAWSPPEAVDALRQEPASLAGDGLVAILGLHRLSAAEEAVRGAPEGLPVTVVLVTADPGELGPLARLGVVELRSFLRAAFPESAWPGLRLVCDNPGPLAAAAGVPSVSDATETAILVRGGRIVARAEGYGACHAAASSPLGSPRAAG